MHYVYLIAAILFETTATLSLKPNNFWSPAVQTSIVVVGYGLSFTFLYLVLKTLPIGIVYATWSGVGITLVAVLGIFLFGQKLDLAAWIGIGLIIAGVLVLNLVSKSGIQ